MTPQDLEKELIELGSTTAPRHSLVTGVMQRVQAADVPTRPAFIWRIAKLSEFRATAALVVLAAILALGLYSLRRPPRSGPVVVLPGGIVEVTTEARSLRVMDIRRIDLGSANGLDAFLRDRDTTSPSDPEIRASDVSRNNLNLY